MTTLPLRIGLALMLAAAGSASITLARTRAQQARWTARLLTQFGDVDGPATLSEVWDPEIGRNDEVFVAQPTTGSIMVFSAQGQPLRTIGRRGQGPGEFQTVGRLGWTGDTLWALNFRSLNLFRNDGSFVRQLTPASLPDLGPHITIPTPGPILGDGTIMVIPNVNGAAIASGERTTAPVVRVTQSGKLVDTLAIVSLAGGSMALNIEGRRSHGPHLYPGAPLWLNTADGQGLVIVDRRVRGQSRPSEFRVIRTSLSGDTIVNKAHAYQRVPLTGAWREDLLRRAAPSRTRNGAVLLAVVERELRAQIDLPAFHTPVTELVTGRDGTIWLRREHTTAPAVDWWVLDGQANLAGVVQLPTTLRVFRADRQTVWGVARDSLDVPRVQIYRISSTR